MRPRPVKLHPVKPRPTRVTQVVLLRTPTDQNEPDILTKPMDLVTLTRHTRTLGFEVEGRLTGRAALERARAILPMADEE